MALAFTLRADDPDDVNATAFTTAAFTPSASAGVIVAVYSSKGAAPDTPTLDVPTWLDGSWTQLVTDVSSTDISRLTVFSGKTIASPGSDDLTASFGGLTQTGCTIHVIDITGVDIDNFVAQAEIVHSTVNATNISETLNGALASVESACLGIIGHQVQSAHTPAGSEIELADSGHAAPARQMVTQYEINNTTSGASWTGSASIIIAVMEILVDGAGAPIEPTFMHVGLEMAG